MTIKQAKHENFLSRTGRCVLLGSLAAAAALVAQPTVSEAAPARGDVSLSVLLCRFNDVDTEPYDDTSARRFLTEYGMGTGGITDYFLDQSGGNAQVVGTVRDWVEMPRTASTSNNRSTIIQSCVDAHAASGYRVPSTDIPVAIVNAATNDGEAGGRLLLGSNRGLGFAAHELAHVLGLGHSFSNDTSYQNAAWSQPGEYDDPWDLMSAMAIHDALSRYGTGAVGLNAFHRDRLGWITRERIVNAGSDGQRTRLFRLAPLEDPRASGYMLVRIPFDVNDRDHYYTLEYRRPRGQSAGIPEDTVLIHEVNDQRATLLRDLGTTARAPSNRVVANGVTIDVLWERGSSAYVYVTLDDPSALQPVARRAFGPNRCRSGYVWRSADATDYVCVTPQTRARVASDNAAAEQRWIDGPYGTHTCIAGFVWREAFAGDDVCVTPDQRTAAARDNQAKGRYI